MKVLVVCSNKENNMSSDLVDNTNDFNQPLNKEIINKFKTKDDETIDFTFCNGPRMFPDNCLKEKYDVIWFAGCNIISWIIDKEETIVKIFNNLNDDGIFLFTESTGNVDKYYGEHGKPLESLIVDIEFLISHYKIVYNHYSRMSDTELNKITDEVLKYFTKVEEGKIGRKDTIIYYKKNKIHKDGKSIKRRKSRKKRKSTKRRKSRKRRKSTK